MDDPNLGCLAGERAAWAVAASSRRMLVCADEGTAGHLAELLMVAGFDVVVHDPAGCVGSAAVLHPNLVVLHISRPCSDAPALIGDITSRGIAPVVLLVAAQAGLLERANPAGAAACLVSPFSPTALRATVELILSRHTDPDAGADEARRLQDRNLVERAKALLMCHQEMAEAAAHRWLQRTAMNRRVKLTRVATEVIERWSSVPDRSQSRAAV